MKRGNYLIRICFSNTILSSDLPWGSRLKKKPGMLRTLPKVSFGVAGNLYINIGPEFKVVLEGEKKDLDDIITEVSGGKACNKERQLEIQSG